MAESLMWSPIHWFLSTARRVRRLIMATGRFRLGALLAAAMAITVGLGLLASSAEAGRYTIAQCAPGLNPAAADATFTASTTHYRPFVDCGPNAPGLQVRHSLSTGETGTVQGAFGAWEWKAPAGTFITGGSTISRLATEAGHHGFLAVTEDSGASIAYQTQNDNQGHTAGPPGGNSRFLVARLECTVPNEGNRCVGSGTGALASIKWVQITLTDVVAPTLSISGSMFSGAILRGPQTIGVAASDQGAGLQRVEVTVNGQHATGDDLSAACNPLPGGFTSRMAPCPPALNKTYTIDTAAAPFGQGANLISVCAYDYFQTETPNSACESREVVVDNLCPGSRIGGGNQIVAGFGNGKQTRTLPFRKRALIRGKLFDAGGNPVAGADVCISGNTNLPDRPPHLIGTTTTNENGGWSFKLRKGPSRVIRVSYRFGAFQTTSDLELDMRARSTFHLSTHRTCVGNRIYFSGGIAGPRLSHKVVVVRGTIPGSKRIFLIRRAKTDPLGHFRVGYAFAPLERLTRFAFWAVVPENDNYPYVRGRSVVRYIRVRPHKCRSGPRHSNQRRIAHEMQQRSFPSVSRADGRRRGARGHGRARPFGQRDILNRRPVDGRRWCQRTGCEPVRVSGKGRLRSR